MDTLYCYFQRKTLLAIMIASIIILSVALVFAICDDTNPHIETNTDITESYEESSQADESVVTEEYTDSETKAETTTDKVVVQSQTTRTIETTSRLPEIISETVSETVPKGYYVIACSDYELDILAATVYHEAGSNECTDRHQQLVAQVVINRVLSNEFPNTIYDVVTQNGQYENNGKILSLARSKDIPQRCYDNAILALRGEVNCPYDVVWQANFVQGRGVYEKIKTSYSTSYFCYR